MSNYVRQTECNGNNWFKTIQSIEMQSFTGRGLARSGSTPITKGVYSRLQFTPIPLIIKKQAL